MILSAGQVLSRPLANSAREENIEIFLIVSLSREIHLLSTKGM